MDEEWAAEDMGLEAPASQVQQPDVVIGSSRDDGKVFRSFENNFICQCFSKFATFFSPIYSFAASKI